MVVNIITKNIVFSSKIVVELLPCENNQNYVNGKKKWSIFQKWIIHCIAFCYRFWIFHVAFMDSITSLSLYSLNISWEYCPLLHILRFSSILCLWTDFYSNAGVYRKCGKWWALRIYVRSILDLGIKFDISNIKYQTSTENNGLVIEPSRLVCS